jgi:hypothetical protein
MEDVRLSIITRRLVHLDEHTKEKARLERELTQLLNVRIEYTVSIESQSSFV